MFLSNLYRYSVYPTLDEVKNELESISRIEVYPHNYLKTIWNSHKLINITQEELCKMPGVYYNFICRATDLTAELIKNRNRTGINTEPKSILGLNPNHNLRHHIQRAISEAELQRKPYIKKHIIV